MSDLRDVYSETVLEHGRTPRNEGPLESATGSAKLHNPLCGDRVSVHVQVDGQTVMAVRFEGKGCALSKASASMLTEAIQGSTVSQARTLAAHLRDAVKTGAEHDLGDLNPLLGVRQSPGRKRCVTLAWEALEKALADG